MEYLVWWCCPRRLCLGVPSTASKLQVIVTSDASMDIWGLSCQHIQAAGKGSNEELSLHINALELLAVLKALQLWSRRWEEKAVIFLLDNKTAVTC